MTNAAYTIGLIGNPNCGKTTLFNALTGNRQRVGNWPGVTVERKTGEFRLDDNKVELVDLPGTYGLHGDGDADSLDEQVAQQYIQQNQADCIINVIDASSIERGLFLTSQLRALKVPLIIVLNMVDVAQSKGIKVSASELEAILECPVIEVIASRNQGLQELKTGLSSVLQQDKGSTESAYEPLQIDDIVGHFSEVDTIAAKVKSLLHEPRRTLSERIDDIILNRFLSIPIFLLIMYLLFMFSINMGTAFQDFFDIIGGTIFVEVPRFLLSEIGSPDWLTAFIAEGVGGGIQLVLTFVPVIGAMFLALSFLEDVGYMARAAFIVDRLMRSLGLPGKSFVPLIVGFGCNVPSIMASRSLTRESDRLITSLMAPFMSCGARLTVYTLFVAAFFSSNGQNIVFALYIIGILVAIFTAWIIRQFVMPAAASTFVMELPPYLMPTGRNLFMHTWTRLKGFVKRAGKAIVAVVIILNVIGSIGVDGTIGAANRADSLLAALARTITPLFAPFGIHADNWPATVGIITGTFAKEVVVGTMNALYTTPAPSNTSLDILGNIKAAFLSIPANVSDVLHNFANPLGMHVRSTADAVSSLSAEGVTSTTISQMQLFFSGSAGAFAYMLFVLLYVPCVATIGAMYKEHGAFWMSFSVLWSLTLAYTLATVSYQALTFAAHPASSMSWIAGMVALQIGVTLFVISMGRRQVNKTGLIPIQQLD
ncbi:Fe(2+) transporter FeoB [BD1-7 clade bacterium]|uniref:Ferrous iron transport protein B n=1 Tax=BD1-7 clade bacterium TaxID=2029982 RepID=A0A5S9QZZ0_9GAMM|nr:Fe(2+) transporter FeoB [BD1-7 clade bacterium]